MNRFKVVIGSGYGDEGKGLMTAFYASQNPGAWVVRFNGGAQAGHCQTGDTLIYSKNGIRYLDEIVGNKTNSDISYPLINMNGEVEKTSLLFTEYNKSINRVVLNNGSELKGTSAHSYYVWDSSVMDLRWVKTIDLDPSIHQFIIPKEFPTYQGCIPKLTPVISRTDYVHNKLKIDINSVDVKFLAFLVGLINGDGHFGKRHRITIQFNIKQMDVIDYVITKLAHIGIPTYTNQHISSAKCITLSFGSSDLTHILKHQLGVVVETGASKSTPTFVLQGSKEIIIQYVRGLMDADGTVKFHKQKKNLSGQLGFSNISHKLIIELQQLLYLCGVHSKIISNSVRDGCQPSWDLAIASRDSILNYFNTIGFPSKYKHERCLTLVEAKNIASQNSNVNGYCVKILPESKQAIYDACGHIMHKSSNIRSGFVNSNNIDGFDKLCYMCANYHIIDIIDIHLNDSIEQVYDVTMPETHSYIANGCISHNTVTNPDDGTQHVFSHFGSGTFSNNITYLSEYFVVNPTLFLKELEDFDDLPTVIIHPRAVVTLPYDMLINQFLEYSRGGEKHGSVGVGFGETLERGLRYRELLVGELWTKYSTLSPPAFIEYLYRIFKKVLEEYVPTRIDLGQVLNDDLEEIFSNSQLIYDSIDDIKKMLDRIIVAPYSVMKGQDLIFEGAQGLLLDQDYGYFPYVTRSNTGMRNVQSIISQFTNSGYEMEVNYVTRAYTTRHGAGPLNNEHVLISDYLDIVDNTNQPNEWQDALRFAPLNVDTFNSVTSKDFALYAPRNASKIHTMTCLDQLPSNPNCVIPIIKSGELSNVKTGTFKNWAKDNFEVRSFGPTIKDVVYNGVHNYD